MRWAKEQGMPIQRVPGAKRSRVFASRSEISQWLAGQANVLPSEAAAPHVKPRGPSRRTLIGAVVASAPIVSVGAFLSLRDQPSPERAVLTGDLVTVLDGFNRTLWTYRFPLRPHQTGAPDMWRIQLLDLEGSGRSGVLVTCNFNVDGSEGAPGAGEMLYFGPDGQVKWTLPCRPDLLDFKGQPFENSWNYSHVVTTPSRTGVQSGLVSVTACAGRDASCEWMPKEQAVFNSRTPEISNVSVMCTARTASGSSSAERTMRLAGPALE